MSNVFWSVDALVIKNNLVFSYGWFFNNDYQVKELNVKFFSSKSGMESLISTDYRKSREDVAAFYPNSDKASFSGYVLYGAISLSSFDKVFLSVVYDNGIQDDMEIPASKIDTYVTRNIKSNFFKFKQIFMLFKRAWHIFYLGKFSLLREKIGRYLNGKPKNELAKNYDLRSILSKYLTEVVYLIVDHDLGGGANYYRKRLTGKICQNGGTAITLSYHLATLSFMLIVENNNISKRYKIPNLKFALESLKLIPVSHIVYNTGVSFPNPDELPEFILKLKHDHKAHFKFLIHDYYSICPSHFLINNIGNFCHLPDKTTCSTCLPNNKQSFTSLFLQSDINRWRSLWGAVLLQADNVEVFSNNSYEILYKSYPMIDSSKISISPHSINYISNQNLKINNRKKLKIGVVGQIGTHKGALFLKELCDEIIEKKVNVEIIVIGTIDVNCDPDVLSQTGNYKHEELAFIIEESGVNIMLFPSIWPETFSYVVHELIELNLPIACFNFGAPAERLRSYPKGFILSSLSPQTVLEELFIFHRNIYL